MLCSSKLVVHGGAGVIGRADMTQDAMRRFQDGIHASLRAGHAVLVRNGDAIEAATAAVMVLEDDPSFNAGRGAVLTEQGRPEMDAAIMRGSDRAAGAVAGICGPRNPILAARAVMERSDHVLLAGPGAMAFCQAQGLAFAPDDYFETELQKRRLHAELARRANGTVRPRDDAATHGTVGAVAVDRHGFVAAATSTGGMTGKRSGRVGDSPLIGAGTWADSVCAISATGHGEMFIRYNAASDVAARVRYLRESIEAAASHVINHLATVGGSGGLIAIDARGHVAMSFNGQGMYRGMIGEDGIASIGIYEDVRQFR